MISLEKIAEAVQGVIEGDAGFVVSSLRSLAAATPDSLSFFSESGSADHLQQTRAGALLISPEDSHRFTGNKIVVQDPYLAYATVSHMFLSPLPSDGVHADAIIDAGAVLGDGVSVGPLSTIGAGAELGNGVAIGNGTHIAGGVRIGSNTVIEDGVVILGRASIGERCRISPGVVIGASGFGYAPVDGVWQRIEQLGSVSIGNDVDIGANTTIDRGALDDTVIGDGVKLDNQIQVAHNVHIGEHTIIAGCAGIAGSTRIGKRCRIGARGAIFGHLEIVDDVTIFANSTVSKSISTAGEYSSVIPVEPAPAWRRILARIKRLDKTRGS